MSHARHRQAADKRIRLNKQDRQTEQDGGTGLSRPGCHAEYPATPVGYGTPDKWSCARQYRANSSQNVAIESTEGDFVRAARPDGQQWFITCWASGDMHLAVATMTHTAMAAIRALSSHSHQGVTSF